MSLVPTEEATVEDVDTFPYETTLRARFTDTDGYTLEVSPASVDGDNYVRVAILDDRGGLVESLYLTAFVAAAAADTMGKASGHVGIANLISSKPVIRDEERGTEGFVIYNPETGETITSESLADEPVLSDHE